MQANVGEGRLCPILVAPALGDAMPRENVESAVVTAEATLDPVRDAPRTFEAHLAFLFVVIAPALFWAAIVFGASFLAGLPSAPQLGLAVFAVASAFLVFITRALRVRF
jgi:hypothetical protein